MVINTFLVENKNGKSYLFEETFLLANISIYIILGMLFLILSNVEVNFTDGESR